MKSATVYIADDGTRFDDAVACGKYEAQCVAIRAVMAAFGEKWKDQHCDHANGGGYIWHSTEDVLRVRNGLLKIAQTICPHKFIDQALADPTVHESYPARIISDCGHNALGWAWQRIACTDKLGREWGQPYYANHPENGRHTCLSDRREGVTA